MVVLEPRRKVGKDGTSRLHPFYHKGKLFPRDHQIFMYISLPKVNPVASSYMGCWERGKKVESEF